MSRRLKFVGWYAVAGAAVAVCCPRLPASPILFDPDGLAPTNGTVTAGSFGFDTANTLAQASIAGGRFIAPGSTFQLFFQTRMTNLTLSPGGATVTPAGLNGTPGGPAFEDTLVGSVTEIVTSVNSSGGVTFATAPVQNPLSFIRMFYHPGLLSDNFSGAGFAVGSQILSAIPSATVPSSGNLLISTDGNGNHQATGPFDTFDPPGSAPGIAYAGITSVSGSGGAVIGGVITAVDPNFFKSPTLSIRLDAFEDVPFTATTPSQFFNSFANTPTIPANHGPANGVSGPDLQLQSRSSASFDVPEPLSIRLAMGSFVGLLSVRRRQPRGA
jgi:hypothetical protein